MEVLEASDNYLEKLPAKLGDMKRLKCLRQENINWIRVQLVAAENRSMLLSVKPTNTVT